MTNTILKKDSDKNYNVPLGLLRILACFLVIISHLTCLVLNDREYIYWSSASIIYILRACCVPLFLMITGIHLINKEKLDYKKLFLKAIKYLLICLLFSAIYYYLYYKRNGIDFTIDEFIRAIFVPYPHLWYLVILAQIYLFMPLIKNIANNDLTLKIYLVFWLFICILRDGVFEFVIIFLKQEWITAFANLLNLFSLSDLFLYVGYVLLGYYAFYKNKIKRRILFYGINVIIIFMTILYYFWYCYVTGNISEYSYSYGSIGALSESLIIVNVIKFMDEKLEFSNITTLIVKNVATSTFIVYLIHAYWTERSLPLWIDSNIMATIPVFAVIIFIGCSILGVLFKTIYCYILKNLKKN